VREVEKLLTLPEAAGVLRVHPVTLRGWLKIGRIKGIKTGTHWKFDPEYLELWAAQRTS
jgi:excisionase family DNA binding protein